MGIGNWLNLLIKSEPKSPSTISSINRVHCTGNSSSTVCKRPKQDTDTHEYVQYISKFKSRFRTCAKGLRQMLSSVKRAFGVYTVRSVYEGPNVCESRRNKCGILSIFAHYMNTLLTYTVLYVHCAIQYSRTTVLGVFCDRTVAYVNEARRLCLEQSNGKQKLVDDSNYCTVLKTWKCTT